MQVEKHSEIEEQKEKKGASPALLKDMQKSTSRGKSEPIMQKRGEPVPERETDGFESFTPLKKASGRATLLEPKRAPSRQEFYNMFEGGWAKSEFDRTYWSNLREQGVRLLAVPMFDLQSDKKDFSRLVELSRGVKEETWRQQCDEIIRLLGEDNSSK